MASSIVDFIHNYKVRCIDELEPPVLLAEVEGTAGTTSYTYKASYVTLVGESLPSETVVVTTGNATLSGFNKIKLSTTNIPESVTYIRFWKYVGSSWVKIADVAQDPGQLYDIGQATAAATLPTTNTSGRKGVIAICPNPGTLNQRMNWMDLQAIWFRKDQRLWNGTHRDGDIIKGCSLRQKRGTRRESSTLYYVDDIIYIDSDSQFAYICTTQGTTASSDPGSWPTIIETTKTDGTAVFTCICDWDFTPGEVYIFGIVLDIPAGSISLTGHGTEKVGVIVTPIYTTSNDDVVQRAGFDEGVPPLYANTGPDWLYLELTWAVDVAGQIKVTEFLDGIPKMTLLPTERTELQKRIAEGIYDVSGHFVNKNFSYQVVDHETDESLLKLKIGSGIAYPKGFKVQHDYIRFIEFNKARVTAYENGSSCNVFDHAGGVVTGSIQEIFSLSGKSLKFRIGGGNYHTVAFTVEDTAAEVGAAIAAHMVSDGYPTDLITYVASGGYLQLRARDGYNLEIATLASNDAGPILGLAAGTYTPQGTRLYELNHLYIKSVTDLSYKTESVIAITRSNISQFDGVEDLSSILCVADSEADAYDEKATYSASVDYQRSVEEGVGTCIDWSLGGTEPVAGVTYYAKIKKNYEPTIGTRQKVLVVDALMTKGAEDGQDNLTFTGASSITRAAIDPATGEPYGTSVSLSGAASDVIEILRVNNSAGQSSTQYTSYSLLKNSGALSHSTSQIDWSAAGTQGVTGTGQPTTSLSYYVTFYAWAHITEGDVITAASYDSYSDIEVYSDVFLRDCLDFRTTGTMPGAGEDPNFDYEYYLGRIDKLTVDDFGNFILVTGAPALSPPTPPDQSGVLTLAVVRIPPYTYDKSYVSVVSLEPIRITQAGIQRIQERVERLEYWQTKNDLEKEMSNKDLYGIMSGSAVVAEKQGIFTDPLIGFSHIDLGFNKNGISHTMSIDNIKRIALLSAAKDVYDIAVDEAGSTNVSVTEEGIMLAYQPELIQEQPFASITINGEIDYVYNNYYGNLQITPETDIFVDEEQLPQINIDFDNNLGNLVNATNAILANQVNWNNWSNGAPSSLRDLLSNPLYNYTPLMNPQHPDQYAGIHPEGTTFNEWYYYATSRTSETVAHSALTSRTGTYQQLIPGSIQQDLGSRVVDLSLQGMMRAGVTISCSVVGLMPNVDHAVTMNGIACDFTYNSAPVNASGSVGTHSYSGKTTVTASNTGTLTATFLVPENIPIGSAEIRIFYYANPDISSAWAAYYTAGFKQSNQNTVIGLPNPQIVTESASQSGRREWIEKVALGPWPFSVAG